MSNWFGFWESSSATGLCSSKLKPNDAESSVGVPMNVSWFCSSTWFSVDSNWKSITGSLEEKFSSWKFVEIIVSEDSTVSEKDSSKTDELSSVLVLLDSS